MRGSIVKRGAGYSVEIELDRDPVTGKRRQKWHSGYATKREAERARVDLLAKLDSGGYVQPARQTLADFLLEWMDARRSGLKPTTEAAYGDVIRAHIVPRIGNVPLQKVDGALLDRFYADLLREGRRDGQGGLAPKTVRNRRRAQQGVQGRRALAARRPEPRGRRHSPTHVRRTRRCGRRSSYVPFSPTSPPTVTSRSTSWRLPRDYVAASWSGSGGTTSIWTPVSSASLKAGCSRDIGR